MNDLLKESLKTSKWVLLAGSETGGTATYDTDGGKVFVKRSNEKDSYSMFNGEMEAVKAIANTGTVRIPKPLAVVKHGNASAIALEYVDLGGLGRKAGELGERMAKLHLHNSKLKNQAKEGEAQITGKENKIAYVSKFGFHTNTWCGLLPQDNDWCDDWVDFYARKLNYQINLTRDGEAMKLWSEISVKLPEFFKGIEIEPSLLHGDLWSGNVGIDTNTGEPLIYDPSSFYGHHEFDLAISDMFGGFGKSYWDSYHKIIPKSDGWDKRHTLYVLFHYLNHWNIFGSGYRASSLSSLKKLVRY